MKRSLRILVVDDDADNANSLGELFEMEGHRPLWSIPAKPPSRLISRKISTSRSWM